MLVLCGALLASGCKRARPPPGPPPGVEIAGCAAVHAGPICELGQDRRLRLWVAAAADGDVALALGGHPVPVHGTPLQGGMQISLDVPAPDAGRREAGTLLTISLPKGATTFELPIVSRVATPALEAAETLRLAGKLDEAEARLAPLLHDPRADVRAQATGKLARIARRRGDPDRAVELFRGAVALDRSTGRVSDELLDSFALAYTLLYPGRRFTEARGVLSDIAPLLAQDPEGRAKAPYYLGLIAFETGDYRTALRSFDAAAEGAMRLGMRDAWLDALQLRADVLSILGRYTEAAALLRQVHDAIPAEAGACRRAQILNDMGWLALRAAAQGASAAGLPEDPTAPLEEALRIHRGTCPEPARLGNVLTNLSLAELDRGRLDPARRHLDEARAAVAHPDARMEVWWLLLEGRIALAAGRVAEALDAYDRLAEIAEGAVLPEARFEAELGRARALEAQGRLDDARRAYERADVLLDEQSLWIPLGEGRDTFLGRREQGASLHVDFLLRRARRDEARADALLRDAAAVARRSRARIVTALQWVDRLSSLSAVERGRWEAALAAYRRERAALDRRASDDWRLAKNKLAAAVAERRAEQARLQAALEKLIAAVGRAPTPTWAGGAAPLDPAEGELHLLYHPTPDGWTGFAITSRSIAARSLGAIEPSAPHEKLATQLLAPFGDLVDGARRVRFMAYGALDHLDFHALPWKGRPLLAHAVVTYGVDLQRPAARAPAAEGRAAALLIVDPEDNLPAARAEADAVARGLSRIGLQVIRIEGAAASHDAVRAALQRPDLRLLHYAGHGVFEGRDGWESGLPLSRNGRLTVSDIMSLPRSPELVVLSGCETARTTDTARAAGLGLAQAFTVMGATAVVAATRKVDDDVARSLMGALYDGPLPDLPAALRMAQMKVGDGDRAAGGAGFRVLLP